LTAENHHLKYLNFKFSKLYNSKKQVCKYIAKKFTIKKHDDETFQPVSDNKQHMLFKTARILLVSDILQFKSLSAEAVEKRHL